MFEKINTNEIKDNLADVARGVGFTAMGGAMLLTVAEVSGAKPHAVVPVIANFQPAGEHGGNRGAGHESTRRVEETGPHHATYGTVRTPSRSGNK